MKVGRNSKCLCGSGLKYKYCCLNKDGKKNSYKFYSPYNNSMDYDLLKKLIKIFNEYEFFDLCRAVFSINAYRANRSNMSFSTTLNFALKVCNKSGKNTIHDYPSFNIFFNKIKQIYIHSYMDDHLCSDFGEVKINFQDEFYRVILGNGFNHSFSLYSISNYIAQELNRIEEFKIALSFYNELLDSLFLENPYDETLRYDDLYCPNQKFFNSVIQYYVLERFNKNKELWMEVFCTGFIEKEHFIEQEDKLFLIFNTSFLIDFICHYLYKIDGKLNSMIVTTALGIESQNLFEDKSHVGNVMWPIKVSFDNKATPYVYAKTFLHEGDKNILIISEKDLPKNQSMRDVIKNILNQMINGNLYLFEPYEGRMLRGINLPKDSKLMILFCDEFINLQDTKFDFIDEDKSNFILFLDLIHILKRAKSISEIYNFFDYYINTDTSFLNYCDGSSGVFETWKSQNGVIEQGALKISMLGSDVYNKDFYIFEYFRNELYDYPYYPYSVLFKEPFEWEIRRVPNAIYYSSKSVKGFGGTLISYKGARYFFCHNMNLYPDNFQMIVKQVDNLKLLDEINCTLFNHYFADVINFGANEDIIQFLHVPFDPGDETLSTLGKYVKGSFYSHSKIKQVIFSVDIKKLVDDLLKSDNRSVEIEYFLEILKCVPNVNIDKITNKLNLEVKENKITSIIQYECKHYKNTSNICSWAEDKDFISVRKKIAHLCKDNGVQVGQYRGEDALKIIRDIQKVLQPYIENIVSQFDKVDLHKNLLSSEACYVFSKNVNNKKYEKNHRDDNIEWAKRCIEQREEDKAKIRFINYLIETNLFVDRVKATRKIKQSELRRLFAYSDWFVVLQDFGDEFKWDFENISIEIMEDFRVNTLYEGELESQQSLGERIYRNKDYIPERNVKKEVEVLLSKLSEDLGFSFVSMLNLLNYCCNEFYYTFKDEDYLDVFSIDTDELLKDISKILKNVNEIEDIKKSIDYLTIDITKIKTTYDRKGNPVIHELVPIWEREQRIDRIDVKPFIKDNNKIIFSPTIIFDLLERWQSGIIKYYPPYEKGLERYLEQTRIFKSECEKQMEIDIYKIMHSRKQENDICEINLDLNSRFPKSGYPLELGDYDGLFIDTSNNVIWNIESKFLQHVGSISEFAKHQNTFFNKNNKDEKFERRINYLNKNLEKILNDFRVKNENYKIFSYMVTNKVFVSNFKKVNIEIITYDEFCTIFNNFYSS